MLLMISMVSAVAQNQAYHMDKWQVRPELITAQRSAHKIPSVAYLESVALRSELWHLVCAMPKDEHVVLANLLSNLNIGAVHGANDETAVHHELHVACARGLCACCGDLLGQLCACKCQHKEASTTSTANITLHL